MRLLKNKLLLFFRRSLKNPRDYPTTDFIKGGVYNVDTTSFLKSFLRKGHEKVYLNRYKLLIYAGFGEEFFRGIWLDTNYCFIFILENKFFRKRSLLAYIGFDFNSDNNEIIVKQIQGVKNKKNELEHFRWEKMLLAITIDWARHQSFRSVRVIQGKNQVWHSDSRKESFFMKYDVTARRSGFKFDQENGNYFLIIN